MLLNSIFALFTDGIFSLSLRLNKIATLSLLVSVLGYLSIASSALPEYLMERLQTPYSPRLQSPVTDDTAFVVFGMGTQKIAADDRTYVEPLAFAYGPLMAAVDMYHQCAQGQLKCTFITAGADIAGNGISEAEVSARALIKAGIPTQAIIREEESLNTWERSRHVGEILHSLRPKRVVLLQNAPMMKRSLLYLEHFGVIAEPMAAAYLTTSHTNMSATGLNFLAAEVGFQEHFDIWRYALYNYLGWNEPKEPPLPLGELSQSST